MFFLNSPRLGFYFLAFLFVSLTIWVSITVVDVSVPFEGKVRPLGNVVVVQNSISGVIKNIIITEGELVDQHQTLLELDSSDISVKIKRLRDQIGFQSIRLARLEHQRRTDIEFLYKRTWDVSEFESERDMLLAEVAAYQEERLNLSRKLEALDQQLAIFPNEFASVKAMVELSEKKLDMTRKLMQLGYEGELAFLDAQADLRNALFQMDEAESKAADLARQRELVEGEVKSLRASFERSTISAITESRMTLRDLKSELEIAETDFSRHQIRATVSGVVSRILIENEGQSVSEPETLVEIIPREVELAFDGRIGVADIGKVYVGQAGKVMLVNMDLRQRSAIDVEVIAVGLDAQTDDRSGQSFYSVTLRLLASEPQLVSEISAGVEGQGFLAVGTRSTLAYILEPITQQFFGALGER